MAKFAVTAANVDCSDSAIATSFARNPHLTTFYVHLGNEHLRILRTFSIQQEYATTMAVFLYVGGSKDGEKGVVPYGFSKTRADTEHGPEIYVERTMEVEGRGKMRVMALESLRDEILFQRLNHHLR